LQAEERERKELEKRQRAEQKERDEIRRRLEEKHQRTRRLLEEEAASRQETETQMDESGRDTEYNLLESMVKGGGGKGSGEEDLVMMEQRTIPQTPLIEGVNGGVTLEQAELQHAGMTAVLEASMRTEMTIVVDREDGNLIEESKQELP
jgi:hypothetical protein